MYQQCPKKYQFQYIDKLEKEFKSSPDLILGTSVHSCLEWLYQQVNVFRIPTKEEVLNKFHEIWEKEIKEV
ncbi:PD-(D/E)XK nuclease family protein [bacterium]|nr:PD-(D/E)XK nuclease family protein [bacterium]